MSVHIIAAYALHTLFAGAWVGAVFLTAWKVVPAAKAGDADPDLLAAVGSGLSTLTRGAALFLLATGGLMIWTVYDGGSGLLVPPRGHTVLTMVVLWVGMTGLVEAGAGRLREGAAEGKVRTAGREADRFLKVASVLGGVLLLIGGYLAAPA